MNVVRKSQLKIVERLGTGKFGEAHLCYFIGNKSSALVVVKSLDSSCSFEKRSVLVETCNHHNNHIQYTQKYAK